MEIEGSQREIDRHVGTNGHRSDLAGVETARNKARTDEIFLSVVIPAYNEERRLPATLGTALEWLDRQPYRSEMLVVDDGSEDGTVQVIDQTLKERGDQENSACQLQLVANEHRGKGFAVRTGMLRGQGKYILFSDADFSTPLGDVEKLLVWLEQGYDVAIGSREGQDARRYDEPFYRHLMGRVFNLLVRVMTFTRFQDTQCGFKAFTRASAHDLFKGVQLYGEGSRTVKGAMVTGFDVEILFLARKKGYRVREVPVQWYHVAGSKVNPVKDSLRMIRDVVKVRLNDLLGVYKVKEGDVRHR